MAHNMHDALVSRGQSSIETAAAAEDGNTAVSKHQLRDLRFHFVCLAVDL